MVKTNYHTHCYLCGHAEGLPSDYIKKAIDLGFSEIGISDHGPLLPQWSIRMDLDRFENIYLKDINDAIDKYQDKIKIYKGLELEYYPEYEEHYKKLLKKLDYMVLGQHAMIIDGKVVDIYKDLTKEEVKEYFREAIVGVNSKYFKILAHPDLFMLRYKGDFDKDIIKWSRELIEECIKNDVYLEMNVNGARRGTILNKNGEITWKYPYIDFWRIVATYKDAKVIMNSDCHKLDHLFDNVNLQVIEFAKKMNIKLSEKIGE